jgi:hypothetical protein
LMESGGWLDVLRRRFSSQLRHHPSSLGRAPVGWLKATHQKAKTPHNQSFQSGQAFRQNRKGLQNNQSRPFAPGSCWKYNGGKKCPGCNFPHKCSDCTGPHPTIRCTNQGNRRDGNFSRPSPMLFPVIICWK